MRQWICKIVGGQDGGSVEQDFEIFSLPCRRQAGREEGGEGMECAIAMDYNNDLDCSHSQSCLAQSQKL